MSEDGVSVYAIYIDKEAPKVYFSQTDDNGNLKEIPVDGVEVHEISSKDLYIGSIPPLNTIDFHTLPYIRYQTFRLLEFIPQTNWISLL